MNTNENKNSAWAAAKTHALIKRCLTSAAAELIAHATARDERIKNLGVEPRKTPKRGL